MLGKPKWALTAMSCASFRVRKAHVKRTSTASRCCNRCVMLMLWTISWNSAACPASAT
jgi:hypothetical protein